MKRKKNHPDRFSPDKYRDGPKKLPRQKQAKSSWDDDNLDDAFDEWQDMRHWNDEADFSDDGEEE